jgi:anti-sigma regulatory factor (Ser/Thr protein kinase)
MPTRAVADDLRDVDRAVQWADAWLAEAGVAEAVRLDIQVCIEEALANLILHAKSRDGDKAVRLAVYREGDTPVVRVFDRCRPFDTAGAPLPAVPGLDDERIGGSGLRLIRGLAGDLAYRTSDHENELVLTFPPAGGTPPNPST